MAKSKRNLSLVRELLQTRVVMMEQGALQAYRSQLLKNFNQHILSEDLSEELLPTERHHMVVYKKGTHSSFVTALQFFDNNLNLFELTSLGRIPKAEGTGDEAVPAHEPEEDEERVLMLELTGPVTRCGGMCSYGSIDFRDLMLEYADDPSVVGLVLITDTPGGTAFAMHDFRQGIEAWNAAGKRSIQWIDGMSCSAGVAMGSQCQRVIAMNPNDVVGCIGAMMAGWTTADGAVDQDGNRYIDITATQTPDKNGELRAAAAGDYDGLQKIVDDYGQEFIDLLSEVRPQIPPEQKTGHTYDAGECIGTLIDGIGTLDDAVHYVLTGEEVWKTPTQTFAEEGQPDIDDPDHNPDEDPDWMPEDDPMNSSNSDKTPLSINQPDTNYGEGINSPLQMTLLEKIAAALGITVAEQETALNDVPQNEQAEGTTVENTQQEAVAESDAPAEVEETQDATDDTAEAIANQTALIASMTEQLSAYDKQVTNLMAEKDQLTSEKDQLTSENNQLASEKAQLVSDKESLTSQLSAVNVEKESLTSQLSSLTSEVNNLKNLLSEANTELKNLQESAPAAPQSPAAPHAEQQDVDETPTDFAEGMTAAEIIAVQKKKDAKRSRRRKV